MVIKNTFFVSYNDGDKKGCGRVQKLEFFGDELALTVYESNDELVTVFARFCICEFIFRVDEIDEMMDRDKVTLENLSRIKFFMLKYMDARKSKK